MVLNLAKNKFLNRGLIDIQISSIVNEDIKTNSIFFFFF